MKKIILSLCICFLSLGSLTSCSVFNVKDSSLGEVDVAKVIRYIEPASYFACKTLLSRGENDADRTQKAQVVFSIARVIRSLADGNIPSPEDLEAAVSSAIPIKVHWLEFVSELSMIYDRFYDNVTTQEQNVLIFEALGELAEGCERAAKPYITVSDYENYIASNVEPFEMGRAVLRSSAYRVMGVKKFINKKQD
jgi:hypothetical protein